MRITSVELHPEGSSEVCVLSFRDPQRSNPYNVKAVIGLDADEIVARYYGGSGNSEFYNLTLEQRDVIVRVQLNPRFHMNESYSNLRDALYRMISSSRTGKIQIQFKDGDTVVAATSGSVSKLEAPHFNKEPEVQITIECSDPMLRALEPVSVDVSNLDPADTSIVDDISTAPHGFKFEMTFNDEIPSFKIGDTDWAFEIVPPSLLVPGDVLHISSEQKNKYVYVVRGGEEFHLADSISPGSNWPILFPGVNNFVCDYAPNLIWVNIEHYPTYWGV